MAEMKGSVHLGGQIAFNLITERYHRIICLINDTQVHNAILIAPYEHKPMGCDQLKVALKLVLSWAKMDFSASTRSSTVVMLRPASWFETSVGSGKPRRNTVSVLGWENDCRVEI